MNDRLSSFPEPTATYVIYIGVTLCHKLMQQTKLMKRSNKEFSGWVFFNFQNIHSSLAVVSLNIYFHLFIYSAAKLSSNNKREWILFEISCYTA